MTSKNSSGAKKQTTPGVWDTFFTGTIGRVFSFLKWSVLAVFFSIIIEWIGMAFLWEIDHSRYILKEELSYLSAFSENLITGLYPKEIADTFLRYSIDAVKFLHLTEISQWLSASNGLGMTLAYGVEAVINISFIFGVRLAICISAITGFILVAVVASIDGLTQRDIRRDCAGRDSPLLYHTFKRWIYPFLILTFGMYLTLPISIHPTIVFLPAMCLFGLFIYITTYTFQKFI